MSNLTQPSAKPKEIIVLLENIYKIFKNLSKVTITSYKKIIFDADTPVCRESLNKLRRQQTIDEMVSKKEFVTHTVRMLASIIIDKSTSEILGIEVYYACYKKKL